LLTLSVDTTKITGEFKVKFSAVDGSSRIVFISSPHAGVQVYTNTSRLYNQGAYKNIDNTTTHTVITNTTATNRNITVNGSSSSADFNRSITDEAPMYIIGSPAGTGSSGNYYYFKIYRNDVLVFDGIPVRIGATGYMYDRVSGQLFGNSGTGNFVLGPDVVPTPDKPIDIWCNNGVIKARHQSGLPLGYTLLDYINFTSTQVIDTGFVPDNNSRIESKFRANVSNCWLYGASANNPRVTLFVSGTGTSRWGYKSRSNLNFSKNVTYTLIQDVDGVSINNVLRSWNSGTYADFICDSSLTIGNCNNSSGTTYFSGSLYYLKIHDNNILVRNLIPCKNPTNTVGLYDLVNNVFYTAVNLGAGNET
jgi:hypothetical protein